MFVPNVKGTDKKRLREVSYDLSIKSWQYWCDKNNCDLIILDELIHPHDVMKINFHRYYAFDILDNSGVEYDQILITDADAIIHPDCPNFFELTDNKYTVTMAGGSYDWICRSLENYSKFLFNNKTFPLWNYFNAGFQIVNKSHRYLWDKLIDTYFNNQESIRKMQDNFYVGTDQPIINFVVNLSNVETKFLPYQYCMADLHGKGILDEDLTFTKVLKGIYQYNAIPDNDGADRTLYWMKKTYDNLYGELK